MIEINAADKSARIVLEAYLDAPHVEELRVEVRRAIADGCIRFVLDLRETQFMCSGALGLLVEMHNRVSAIGGRVVLENLNPPIQNLLSETKLLSLFTQTEAPELDQIQALEAVQDHMGRELLFLSFINTITSNILLTEPSEKIYGQMLEAILRSLRPRRALLVVIAEGVKGPTFQVAATEGFDEKARARIEVTPLREDSREGRCLASRKADLFAPGWRKEGPPSPLLKAAGVEEGILEPVMGRDKPFGLIVLEAEKNAPAFFEQSAPLLQVFANVCGLALEKQALLENIRYKNERLSQTLSELNSTRDSLMEAGKLAVTGALIRGLSHTLNNKLVPITGYAQMLSAQLGEHDPELEKIGAIETAALDIKKTIDHIRGLTFPGQDKALVCDVRDIINLCLRMQDYMFREAKICVKREFGDVDARVPVYRERITQAFLALFHRLPKVFAGTPEKILRVTLEREKSHLVVRMWDNGRVLPREELEAADKPFDTDNPFEDERFNFSIVRSVLKDHRGSFEIESSSEIGGTCAILRLPLERKVTPGDTRVVG